MISFSTILALSICALCFGMSVGRQAADAIWGYINVNDENEPRTDLIPLGSRKIYSEDLKI